jgi:hypothetical protein
MKGPYKGQEGQGTSRGNKKSKVRMCCIKGRERSRGNRKGHVEDYEDRREDMKGEGRFEEGREWMKKWVKK